MRFKEFNQLDEILPATGGMAVRAGLKGAKTQLGAVGNKMGKATKTVGNMATNKAKQLGQGLAKKAQKVGQAAGDMAAQKLLKPGAEIPIGGQNVKVDKVSGSEVILADPKNKNAPKTIVQKKDPIIKQALKSITT
tara:strand:+ start:2156 stop:2563 length:408 start_codon:yes stop_codon:yes gene_type:complete